LRLKGVVAGGGEVRAKVLIYLVLKG
jgi:hypothetical protein